MVLPEKLVGLGFGFNSLLSPADAVSHKALRLRDLGDLTGSSTTDLVRFSGTLKAARGIVEDHRRPEIIEVPTSGLLSILDRIKALEKEVQDLLDGKGVSKNSKAIESPKSGSASSGSPSSGPTSSGSASGGSTSSGSASTSPIAASSGSGSGSNAGGANSGSGTSGGGSSSPSTTASGAAGSPDGSGDSKDDCGPEHLLYRLGAASLERRSMTSVSAHHPLFRRTTNCTLESVSGGGGGKKEDSAPPSGGGVFKEGSSSANSHASDSGAGTAPPPATVTAGPGPKAKGSLESDSENAATTMTTTTMTSTSYATVTLRLRPGVSHTAAGSPSKFFSNTTSIPNPTDNRPSNITAALATESETTATPSPSSPTLPQESSIVDQASDTATAAAEPSAPSSSPVGSGPSAPSSVTPSPLRTLIGWANSSATAGAATISSTMSGDAADSRARLALNKQTNLTLASAPTVADATPARSSSVLTAEPSGPFLAENATTTTTTAVEPAAPSSMPGLGSSASPLPDEDAASSRESIASSSSSVLSAQPSSPRLAQNTTITTTIMPAAPSSIPELGSSSSPLPDEEDTASSRGSPAGSSALSAEPSRPSPAENTTTTTAVVPAAPSTPTEPGSSSPLPDNADFGPRIGNIGSSSPTAPGDAAVSSNALDKTVTSTVTSTTTSTITSTVFGKVPATGRPTTTASSSPDEVAAAAAEGALERRQSGFVTVRATWRRTAAADEHD